MSTPTRTTAEDSKEAAGRNLALDYDHVKGFAAGDTAPKVADLTKFFARGSATITNFKKGQEGQIIQIIGNGTTSVAHNATIKRVYGVTAALRADLVYRFMYKQGIWYEDAVDGTTVRKNSAGSVLGPRGQLNFIEGANVTITIADDVSNGEVDVTIASTGGGGGYTDEQAQDAVGTILDDSGDIDFTYDDVTPKITGAVKADAITFAKMQNIATQRLIGRNTAASGDPEEVTISQALDWL